LPNLQGLGKLFEIELLIKMTKPFNEGNIKTSKQLC